MIRRTITVITLCSGMVLLAAGTVLCQEKVRLKWEQVLYGNFEGKQALLYSNSAFHGKPTFGDLDGDGDLDLLIGKLDGGINRFENVGGEDAPAWRLVEENLKAVVTARSKDGVLQRMLREINTGSHAAPVLADIDNDGDLDLFVGTADGKLLKFQNMGTEVLYSFHPISETFIPPNLGRRIVPFFADINNDLALDLFIGNQKGQVFLLPNAGTKNIAEFCVRFPSPSAPPGEPLPCSPTPIVIAKQSKVNHAAPSLVDWDGDGDLDLFVGKRNGTIDYYKNHGTKEKYSWRMVQRRFLAIDNGGFAAPAFTDVNGDGNPDLLTGSNSNNVYLYTYEDTGRVLDVWKITANLLNVQRIGHGRSRAAITTGDLDDDGDLDAVIGDRGGNLRWLKNTGSKAVPAWEVVSDNLFPGTVRHNTAPLLADIDQDGDLDLLVGGADGKLWLIRNDGTNKEPEWRVADTNYAGIDVGSNSVPALADMDKDGDLDLVIGNSLGLLIYFRNEGGKENPEFRLTSTRFTGLSVGQDAAPTLIDWNDDKLPDLVIGNRAGALTLALNRNTGDAALRNWEEDRGAVRELRVTGAGMPHVNDFNGDGRMDLMVGDRDGNVRLWLNLGVVRSNGKEEQVRDAEPESALANVVITPGAVSQSGLANAPAAPTEGSTGEQPALAGLLSQQLPAGPVTPRFTLASREYAGLKFKGRIVPAFYDLDGDRDQDMIVGTHDGKLLHFRNDGPRDNPKWKRIGDNFAGYDHGRNPTPMFGDLDGDNQTDLLVGTESGRILFFKGQKISGKMKFTFHKEWLTSINAGRNAAPVLMRLEVSQPPLLLVGTFTGNLVAYAPVPGSNPILYKRNNRRFMNIDVGVSAVPVIGDLDQDGVMDMVLGSDQGNLFNFKRIAPSQKNPWGWQKGPGYLKSQKFPAGSSPRLTDIDDDGDQDLFLGTEQGRIYFYRNVAEAR
ncbi:MAG: VCBS repeat-containing protein [SAR324 cluster bacterium]|nr:VCBS repeat-containing protein [SAR324 cluster bacterium]